MKKGLTYYRRYAMIIAWMMSMSIASALSLWYGIFMHSRDPWISICGIAYGIFLILLSISRTVYVERQWEKERNAEKS